MVIETAPADVAPGGAASVTLRVVFAGIVVSILPMIEDIATKVVTLYVVDEFVAAVGCWPAVAVVIESVPGFPEMLISRGASSEYSTIIKIRMIKEETLKHILISFQLFNLVSGS